jgi:flagellar hook-associated protein 2
MASLSVSSSTTTSTSSIRGYGGLASGLDRDSLIETLTAATQSKIATQQKKRQTLEWKQESIRTLTTKMYNFSQKYTSYSSSSNLLASTLYSKNQVTASGTNSKYVSVTGTATTADSFSILGVKSLAQNAQMVSNSQVSNQALTSGTLANSLGATVDVSTLANKTLTFTYGSSTVSVKLDSEISATDLSEVAKSINASLAETTASGNQKMSEIVSVKAENGKLVFIGDTDNKLELKSSDEVMKALGFTTDSSVELSKGKEVAGDQDADISEKVTVAEQLSGKEITFSYNGTTTTVTLGTYDDQTKWSKVVEDIQTQLDKAYGSSRVQVSVTNNQLSFKTITPELVETEDSTEANPKYENKEDNSSTISILYASDGVLGSKGALNIKAGSSNRVNLSESIANSGLDTTGRTLGTGNQSMVISNGTTEIDLAKDFNLTWESSIEDIISTINSSDLGIKVSYQSSSDKFLVTSTEAGASGTIDLKGNLAEALFGTSGTDYTVTKGQDAVVTVKYADSNETMDITRSSNSMYIDGLTVSITGKFGYNDDGTLKTDPDEAVKFTASVNVDKAVSVIVEMINAYNDIITDVAYALTEQPDRDYEALSDAEKEEMTESQITKWETEAKKGLFYGDSDYRNLLSKLGYILPTEYRSALTKMGITVSSDYSDNGKLVVDEDKLRAALQSDPDTVKEVFTAKAGTTSSGTTTSGGLMTKIKSVMDTYAGMTGATKGILVERAGSTYAPTSVLSNTIQKQIDDIDDYIEKLKDKLETETDRYISQFTSLETLISQMNSQSSYLSSLYG